MLPNAMLFQSKSNSSKENPLSVVADLKTLYAAVAEVMPTIANETHVVADQIQTFNWNMSHGLFEPFPTDLTLLKCIVLNASSGATIGGVSTGGSREEVEGKQGEGEENFGPLHKASNSFCRSNLPACTVLCDQLTRYVYVPGINPPSKKDPLKVKMLVEVGVDPDPLSAYGFEWLENARGVFAASLKLPQYSNVEGWLGEGHENGFDERIDMIRRVYKHFPLTAGFVAAIVFVLMGVTFGSVVIAIKAVVSIGLTLSLVYVNQFIVSPRICSRPPPPPLLLSERQPATSIHADGRSSDDVIAFLKVRHYHRNLPERSSRVAAQFTFHLVSTYGWWVVLGPAGAVLLLARWAGARLPRLLAQQGDGVQDERSVHN